MCLGWGVKLYSLTTSYDLDLRPFQLKLGTPPTRAVGNVCANFGLSLLRFFVFELRTRTGHTGRDQWRF